MARNARLALGSQGNSPLLLMTPALLLLSGGLLLLRVIPLAASLGARLASRGRGITWMLVFAQIERTPGRYSRMTLLLVLSVGLGLFALTFDASLAQNVHDRTAYAAGRGRSHDAQPVHHHAQTGLYITHLKTLPASKTPRHSIAHMAAHRLIWAIWRWIFWEWTPPHSRASRIRSRGALTTPRNRCPR